MELSGRSWPLLSLTLIFAFPLKTNSFISPQNLEHGWLVDPLFLAPVLVLTVSVWRPNEPPEQGLIWYVSVWASRRPLTVFPLSFLKVTRTSRSATRTSVPL